MKPVLIVIASLCFAASLFSQVDVDKPNLRSKAARDRFKETYRALSTKEPEITEIEAAVLEKVNQMIAENPTHAKSVLEDMLSSGTPVSAAFNHALGNIYYENDEFLNAEIQFLEAIKRHEDFQRAWNGLGLARFQMNDYDGAMEALSKSVRLGASDASTYGALGYCHLVKGNLKSAETAYNLAVLNESDNMEWTEGLAEIYMDTGRLDEARRVLEQLIRIEPDRVQFWMLLTNVWLEKDEPLKSARCIEIAKRIGPVDAQAHLLLGNIYLREGIYDRAKESLVAALEKRGDISSEDVLESMGYLVGEQEFEMAADLLQRIAGIDDSWSRDNKALYHSLRGDVDRNQGRADAAIDAYESCLALDPFNGPTLLKLAEVFLEKEDTEKASFLLERALSVPDYEYNALMMKTQLLIDNERFADSIAVVERAMKLRPSDELRSLHSRLKLAARALDNDEDAS